MVWPLRTFVSLVCLCACLYVALPARAEPPQPESLPRVTLDEKDTLSTRLSTLEAALRDVKRPTRMYFFGWIAALSTLAVGQTTVGLVIDHRARKTAMFLGAGLSTAGVALMLLKPFPGRYGADELARMPANTPEQESAKLARAEELLAREAKAARMQYAWFQHLLTTGLGVGVGLTLGLLYPDHVWDVALPSALGTFLTAEAQIWTRPKRAVQHWERYASTHTPELTFAPIVNDDAFGACLHMSF